MPAALVVGGRMRPGTVRGQGGFRSAVAAPCSVVAPQPPGLRGEPFAVSALVSPCSPSGPRGDGALVLPSGSLRMASSRVSFRKVVPIYTFCSAQVPSSPVNDII